MTALSGPWRWSRAVVTGGANKAIGKLTRVLGGPARRDVVVLLACVLALDSADASTVGAVAVELQQDFGIANAQIGLLVSVSAFVGAAATVPVGMFVDRVRRTRLLTGSIVLWGAAMVASGLAGSYLTLLFTRLALGAVIATAGPAVASLIGDFFPARERGRVYGFILSGELLGTGIGYVIAGDIASVFTWRAAFFVLAIPAFALAWVLYRWLPEPARGGQSWLEPGAERIVGVDEVDEQAEPAAAEHAEAERQDTLAVQAVIDQHVPPDPDLVLHKDPERMSLGRAIVYVLRVRTNVILIVASALGYFFFAGLRTFALVFVRSHFGLGQAQASSLLPVIGLGAIAGVVAGGRISDALIKRGRLDARILVPAVSFFVAVAAFAPGLVSTSLAISVPLFVVGAAALGAPNPPLDAARLDIMHHRLWGRAEGVRTVLRTIGQGIAPLLFGFVADQFGQAANRGAPSGPGGFGSGAQPVQGSGLEYAFLLMLAALLAGAVLLLKARSTYPGDVATAAASEEATAAQRHADSRRPAGER